MDFDREELIAVFVAESKEGLQLMEETLLTAETNPKKEGLLDDIFRVAHTIKGNAAILEFNELSRFAHVVEDLLGILREQQAPMSKEVAALLLKVVDELRLMVLAAAGGKLELTSPQQQLKKKIAKVAHGHAQKPTSANLSGPSLVWTKNARSK